MEKPFKMKGSSAMGYGNQHSKGMTYASPAKDYSVEKGSHAHGAGKYASPAKQSDPKVDMNDPKVKANYNKYKNNPEYRKALDKKAGGTFSYDEKSNTSTTKTEI